MMKSANAPGVPPWLVYGILYFASAYLGLQLATVEGIISPVWFAAGFALAGVLLHGFQILPGIWLGSAAALLLNDVPPVSSAIMAFGPMLGALVGLYLLRPIAPTHKLLTNTRNFLYLLLFGVAISPLVSASIGVSTLYFSQLIDIDQILDSCITWWVGDATGVILITPFILAWRTQPRCDLSRRRKEIVALLLTSILVCLLVFGNLLPERFQSYPISYLPFTVLAWTVLRFRHRSTTAILLLIAGFALVGTFLGYGPFIQQNSNDTLVLLQIYVVTLSATVLAVKSILSERQLAMNRLALAGRVITHSPDGIIVTDPQGIILSANPAFFRNTGFTKQEISGQSIRKLTSVHHSADFFTSIWKQLRSTGHWEGEIWNRNSKGEILPQWLNINAIRDASGNITHYLGLYSDVSRQKHVQERIHRLAYYDALTGLPNRQLFTDRLNQALKYSGRHNSRLALFFLDLDRFKNINDTLGHSIGDKVLQMTAERLTKCVRQTDTLARIGGDEFTIIIQDVNEDFDAILVAEKVVNAFREPLLVDDHELYITPSIGISLFPDDGNNSEELIKHADTAMYRAKELGGNGFQFFAADMSDPIRWNLTVENALRRAVEQGTIQVVYQPQFDIRSGNIIGLEALARWHHKGPEETPPEVFIKVAEDTGLIHRLGDQIMETACRQMMRWIKEGITDLKVSVNISPLQLKQGDFTERLRRIVENSGVSPRQIELEITEGSLMENAGIMEGLLNLLSVQGFQIAIDDFGTGYSSLSYLKRLSIDRIKIDKSFIHETPDNTNDTAICRAIISMAHSLKLKVIAEGVENDPQMEFLRQERCDEVQGYIYSQAVGPKEVSEMIRQGYWHI